MEAVKFYTVDYLLFALILTISSSVGLYYGCYKKQNLANAYFFGDKQMLLFPTAVSLAASTIAVYTLIGIPTEVYLHGTQVIMVSISVLIVGVLNHYVYLPIFYKLQLNSVYQYLELRFDRSVKSMISLLYIIKSIMYLPILIYATALCLNIVTGFNLHATVWIMAGICLCYTSLGGLRGVVWTDTLEFVITVFTLIYAVVRGIIITGGPLELWQKASVGNRLEFFNMDPDPTLRTSFWSVVVGNVVIWTSGIALNPAHVQRMISLPSQIQAERANIINIAITSIAKIFSCILGLVVYARYAQCDPLSSGLIKKADQVVSYFITDVTHTVPGISGLFVAGLFTAAFGVLSTILNTISAVLYFDFFEHILPENMLENKTNKIIRITAVAIGLLCASLVVVVEKLGSIFELFHSTTGISSGTAQGVFLLGLVFPMVNKKGALVGTVSSFVIMGYMTIQQQIYFKNGNITYHPKPLGINGCNNTYLNNTLFLTTVFPSQDVPFWIFRISFQYFPFIGCILTIVIGIIVSVIFKDKNGNSIKPDLVIPCVRRFISTAQPKVQAVELSHLFTKHPLNSD